SLPSAELCATPASASTCRCFVTAWRVMGPPAVSRAMESGPSELRRVTRRSRVSSPRAAKIGAAAARRLVPGAASGRSADIALDGLHLLGPALLVPPICIGAPRRRNGVEAGLGHGEQRAFLDVAELELHERGRLCGVVDPGLD